MMSDYVIRDATEEEIRLCQDWHGGQWSAFYSLASSGQIWASRVLGLIRECSENYDDMDDDDKVTARHLARWADIYYDAHLAEEDG